MPPAQSPGGFPGVDAAIELLKRDIADEGAGGDVAVRERVAVVAAMLNGWVLIEDQLLEIAGLPPEDRDHARETLLDCIRMVLTAGGAGA